MSSITNVNNNASVVNVGRTTPVSPGAQPASKSIPVVMATDQAAIPVEEQNKVQSEVALSLLGIPRAEVALGIFADVNTYDVNPTEWSSSPQYHITGHGIQHIPTEAGALVEAPRNKTAVLTSKRFFRYQPGRVSAATFGVKSTTGIADFSQNPSIRKFGIFDNFDGYFWETRNSSEGDNFAVVRRSQSLTKCPNSPTGIATQKLKGGAPGNQNLGTTQFDDFRIIGQGASEGIEPSVLLVKDRELILRNRFTIINSALAQVVADYAAGTGLYQGISGTGSNANYYADLAVSVYGSGQGSAANQAIVEEKCKRDLDYWIDFYLLDMEYGGKNHTILNLSNYANAILPNPQRYEKITHTALKAKLLAFAGISSAATAKITTLADIVITAFNVSANTKPALPTISNNDYGTRSKIDTIFAAKSYYWAYYVTNYQANGQAATLVSAPGFTPEEIKYKCQRDLGYIIGGYGNDIDGGGDAETKYNMSMYFKGGRPSSDTPGYGMSIYSQNATAALEIERHTHLRTLILADFAGTANVAGSTINASNNNSGGLGYSSSTPEHAKLTALAGRVISNFSREDTLKMEIGSNGFAGNLVAMRDGIILTHSAVYDPDLLNPIEEIVAVSDTNDQLKLTKGVVPFKGHVKVKTAVANTGGKTGLVAGQVYKVKSVIGPKGNEFTLEDEAGTAQTFLATSVNNLKVETVVPFIFPSTGTTLPDSTSPGGKINQDLASGSTRYANSVTLGYHGYDPANYRTALGINDPNDDVFPKGMVFPYMYALDGNLNSDNATTSKRVGYINTANDLSNATKLNEVCEQIDYINFDPHFVTWVRFNVKPEYWGVYDYRVPRSRYSHDTLDGRTELTTPPAKQRVYSDVATGELGTARPGEIYKVLGEAKFTDSLYNFDFTKVTMLKIEFSWYGAVGALFLAYVPVENGEARWVRVHHLRASNQYKNASLGNATLPITYNTYGGGDQNSLGDGEDANYVNRGYGSDSHSIVKYGASYYIDGGDRGTVRLYSHNNEDTQDAYGKQWTIKNAGNYDSTNNAININATTLSGETIGGVAYTNPSTAVDPRFFMGAKFKSSNRTDQNIKVVWADTTKVYLDGVPSSTTSVQLLVDRANATYELETKKVILSTQDSNAVRNRVQVYPTKLSTSNLGNNPIRMRFKKTPIFQTDTVYSGSFTLNAPYTLTALNEPLGTVGVTESTGAGTYFDNNESLFGWFQAIVGSDNVTVFGRLYKESDEYYFELLESYNGTIQLKAGSFLPDARFEADGKYPGSGSAQNFTTGTHPARAIAAQSVATKVSSEKEGLSSIKISSNTVVPVPNSGVNVATIYLQQGTEQLDLSPYFDYNKEYLSFPLTNQADSLYFAVDSDTSAGHTADKVSIGCTWEEQ